MNNTTVFDITKVSVETYDSKTKKKEWNHLSNTNPNVSYEMKVTIQATDLIFQIYNKADKADMQLNLKVKYQTNPNTGKAAVSPTTLRMIIKPPIIAFRYNIKDTLNNEIVLKKAQFGIPNDLSFQTMIDILVEKGVTLKDSKNRDYVPSNLSFPNYEAVYNEFEQQILDSQMPDLNLQLNSPLENTITKKLSTLKEDVFEIEEENISYGKKHSQKLSKPVEQNFKSSHFYKSTGTNQHSQSPTNFMHQDKEVNNNYNDPQAKFFQRNNYPENLSENIRYSQQNNMSPVQNSINGDAYYRHMEQQSQLVQGNTNGYNMMNTSYNDEVKGYNTQSQIPANFLRRESFYEAPMEPVYARPRRNSILLPVLPQNENSSIVYSDNKVMEKEDIENMMTTVLKNVLPKITNLQKSVKEEEPKEEKVEPMKEVSKAVSIVSNPAISDINGLSLDFFLCLDDQTKMGILKNLGFFQALQLLSKCTPETQTAIFKLVGEEVAIPAGLTTVFDQKKDVTQANQDNDYQAEADFKDESIPAPPTPIKSKKSSSKKPPPKKVTKPKRRTSSTPHDMVKDLETWDNISEDSVEGEMINNRFLRKPKKILPLARIIENDNEGDVDVNNGAYKMPQLGYTIQHSTPKANKPKKSKNVTTVKNRKIDFAQTTEAPMTNTSNTEVQEDSSVIEDEIFSLNNKYKRKYEL